MPVLSARVALCSTWLAGAKRRLKKSTSVGLSGIAASTGIRRLSAGPLRREQRPGAAADGRLGRRRHDLLLGRADAAKWPSSRSLR